MRKVKIAILDMGLDMQDEELRNFCSLVKKIQLKEDLKMNDLNGHGALVAKTIINLCRDVEIYPIKEFNTEIDYKDIFLYELADLKLLRMRIKASLDILHKEGK